MKRFLVGNWKMTLKADQAVELAKLVSFSEDADIEVVLCPTFVHLPLVRKVLPKGIKLGAQNVSRETFGALTGGVCAEQLRDIGCEYVIVGHSERRIKAGESNKIIQEKLHRASEAKLKPILCIGETLDEYKNGLTAQVIKNQLTEVLTPGISKELIIAYEPIWAIGTGLLPSADEVANIMTFINQIITAPVLYGGSVNSKNSKIFSQISTCKGFLVGSASLIPEEFNKIF